MPDIILHHYPQSPVSEKVRVALGMKGLAWCSVEIPRLPPKADLMPLTGGYRLTPVMQIGADVFCDSQCIIRALEARFPDPTLFPGGAEGMAWGVGQWTDGPLFKTAVAVVLGDAGDALPVDFAADRIPLYFGAGTTVQALQAAIPENLVKLRAQFGWMDARLATGRPFMLGPDPGLPDALCYYLIWFVRGRYSLGAEFLSQFPALCAWEERVKAIGHGTPTDLGSTEALDVAAAAEPATPEHADPGDPQGLQPGQPVRIAPESPDSGPPVAGRIVSIDADDVVILRDDPRVGAVAVHFPRVGYRVVLAEG